MRFMAPQERQCTKAGSRATKVLSDLWQRLGSWARPLRPTRAAPAGTNLTMVAPARRSTGSACLDRFGTFISSRQGYNKSVDNKVIAGSTGDRAHSSSPVGL